MIKMLINEEEVVSNKEFTINEEMLSTSSTILNNCYPKSWEDTKDYVNNFYYPLDYSKFKLEKGDFLHGNTQFAELNASGINPSFETNVEKEFKSIEIDGKSYQATSTDPVSPSPDYPSEIECVRGKNLYGNITWQVQTYAYFQLPTLNEDYTLSLKLKEGKTIPSGLYVMFTEKGFYDKTQKRIDIIANGVQKSAYIINTINNVKLNYISVYKPGYKDVLEEYFDIQLEKGTVATSYLPYDTIQVKDVGKNLFDKNSSETQIGYFTSDGTLKSGGGSTITTTYTKIKPNIDMTISGIILEQICFYDENKKFIERVAGIRGSTSNTFNKNANYIRFQAANSVFDLEKIQLELGTTPTDYEPYQENTLNIDLQGNELCSLPNNVNDELVIENGRAKIIKKIGKTIVAKGNFYDGTTWKGYVVKPEGKINKANDRLLCDRAIVNRTLTDGTVYENQANVMFVGNNTDTIETLKAKYNGSTLYYQLATPTEIDLGEVGNLSTFKGINNVSLIATLSTNMNLVYYYKNYDLKFCGLVKNSGDISLNPRYPKYCSLQILDFKTLLSEGETLDFVINNKTIIQAIRMVISAISDYGFVEGNINIFNEDEEIGAYSTLNKTAYDVFQYLADISRSRWTTRLVDEDTIAIDFYDTTLMPKGKSIEYNSKYWEDNKIVDLTFNFGTRDYRNKQIMLSDEVYADIDYSEEVITDGYTTTFNLSSNIGSIYSISINGQEATFTTQINKKIGVIADFYYEVGKSKIESDDLLTSGKVIKVTYIPLVKGRQIVYNNDEVARVTNQIGRKGTISRYESRNDVLSSSELNSIGQTYIKYKGSAEIILNLKVEDNDIYNVGDVVYFDAPIQNLAKDYMVKRKSIDIINVNDLQKIFYTYELTSSFNSERDINYFDNQRNKGTGNISEGDTIDRNIDIEDTANIIFYGLEINEIQLDKLILNTKVVLK